MLISSIRSLHHSLKSKILLQEFKRQLSVTVRCHQEFSRTLISDDGQGIRRITLDDTKKRNALSLAMLDEVKQRLEDVSLDQKVKVVVLGHTGSVFSAGHDLKELVIHSIQLSVAIFVDKCYMVLIACRY